MIEIFSLLPTVEDVLDDVPDGPHKCFVRQYLKDWPYPHLNKYRAGQSFKVELNGVMQMCDVVAIDCSLMQVVFQVSIFFLSLKVVYITSNKNIKLA